MLKSGQPCALSRPIPLCSRVAYPSDVADSQVDSEINLNASSRWMEIAKCLYFDELVESVTCIGNGSSKGIVCGVVKDFSGPTSRSTTCIAIVPNNRVVVANAGDNHCVISRKGRTTSLLVIERLVESTFASSLPRCSCKAEYSSSAWHEGLDTKERTRKAGNVFSLALKPSPFEIVQQRSGPSTSNSITRPAAVRQATPQRQAAANQRKTASTPLAVAKKQTSSDSFAVVKRISASASKQTTLINKPPLPPEGSTKEPSTSECSTSEVPETLLSVGNGLEGDKTSSNSEAVQPQNGFTTPTPSGSRFNVLEEAYSVLQKANWADLAEEDDEAIL
ncbi:hypothetical protein IFM89_033732 [Coptis chinensis]|uniref:PPM-type phosphatase domain-containing protein n=1 Tax=Coptis chinensis TaxID=261450 RepID=A0A835H0W7_9MAGN|nr:hypothetical protein IFM89_033732 [Coptis chinensis]